MDKSKKHVPMAQRRDATGHLNPAFEAELLSHSGEMGSRKDDDNAFLPSAIRHDPLAEEMGEGFLRNATGAEDDEDETLEEVVPEESGGPFIVTTGAVEFATGTDESNPADATREPFPRTSSR
ncbi:MAG: hypothetical protein ABJE95_35305 [Byssovorax sp.]